jgi:hypothetical protein
VGRLLGPMPEGPGEAPPVVWPLPRQIAFGLFALLLAMGIAFYLWWGLSFGVWIDNGVYAVVSTLVLFGLAGMWLVMPEAPTPPPGVPRT